MLDTTLLALALLVRLAGPPAPPASTPTPPEPPPAEVSAPRDWQEPPAGTEADRHLWREVNEKASFAAYHLARIAQSSYRIRYAHYYEELDARASDPATAAVRARLEQAATEAQKALPADGGRIRACRYTLLDLEQRMDMLDDPKVAAEMPRQREAATACVTRLSSVIDALRPRADELEAALLAVDRFLGRAPVAPPPQAAVAADGDPG